VARERERLGGYPSSSVVPSALPKVDGGPGPGSGLTRRREYTAAGSDRDGPWIAVLDEYTLEAAREYVRRHGGHVVNRLVTEWEPLES
jgi:hypothetical protein